MNSDSKNVFLGVVREILSRDRFRDELIMDICEYMVKGNIVVRYNHVPKSLEYEDRLNFSPETINWDMEYGSNTNLCQLYLHSLEPVKYLLQGYDVTENVDYLELASNIIKSWLNYSRLDNDNRFPWYDHCVSDRTLYLIYFIEIIKYNHIEGFQDDIDLFKELLVEQADFLYKDANYTTQNHGTMMDRSLYLLSRYFDNDSSDKWRNKALDRLREAVQRDFSNNMVNWENSSSYHLFNFDLFVVIENGLLNIFGDSLGVGGFQDNINKGLDYMVFLSKPDLSFPVIGDGSKTSFASIKKHPSYEYIHNHNEMKFILSNGVEGAEPEELFKVYPEEGYGFFRNSWDYKNNKNNITYASFIAGYKIKNHKHGDDLSFTYFSKGKDIFVDCGTYTYQAGEFRSHFMSALAHNTVIVDGLSYPFIKGDPLETGILDYGEKEQYSYIVGKNDLYPGVNITRSLYFLKSGSMVIVDDVIGKKRHTYSQLFNLSHRLNTEKITISNNKLQVIEKEMNITVEQVCDMKLNIHRGDTSKVGFGLVSEGFNSMHETTTLEYQSEGRSARFITLISVKDTEDEDKLTAELLGENLVISEGAAGFTIPLKQHVRSLGEMVFLEEEKIARNSYKFTVFGAKPNVEFAWYIMKDGERVDFKWYTESPELEYTFNDSGIYEIQYFIRNKVDQEDKIRYIYENKIKI